MSPGKCGQNSWDLESDLISDFGDVEIGGLQQLLCFSESKHADVNCDGFAGEGFEFVVQLWPTVIYRPAELGNAEVFVVEVSFNGFIDFMQESIFFL